MNGGGIIEIVPNLFFGVKVRHAANVKGVSVWSPRDDGGFQEALAKNPVMMIVDLASSFPWIPWVGEAKRRMLVLKVVAFAGHAEVEKKRHALEAGVDQCFVRAEFEAILPYLMDWAVSPHLEDSCRESLPPGAVKGVELFNQRDFFEQHEVLELTWKAEHRPVRDLYQGILLVGVGCYQIQRGNYEGALKQLAGGCAYLEPFQPSCQGVDVERLLTEAKNILEEVNRLGPEGLAVFDPARFPKIAVKA